MEKNDKNDFHDSFYQNSEVHNLSVEMNLKGQPKVNKQTLDEFQHSYRIK